MLVGWTYCEKRKVFSLALRDDGVEQCLISLRSCENEFQMWGPKQEKVTSVKAMSQNLASSALVQMLLLLLLS